jgi:hypothetical protein
MEKNKVIIVKVIGLFLLIVGSLGIAKSLLSLLSTRGSLNLFAPFEIAAGIGILRLKKWGRMLGIFSGIIGVMIVIWIVSVILIYGTTFQSYPVIAFACLFALLYAFISYFLSRNYVKELFS